MFKSPQVKCDLSGLSVNVGEGKISQSIVRDLVRVFDQFLNLYDHNTAIRCTYFRIINIGKFWNML